MSLETYSKFYFNYEITNDNYVLDFDEGSGEVTASLDIGSYSFTDLGTEIQRALNEVALTHTFVVTPNRTDRTYTISSATSFDLLISTGSHAGTSAYAVAGFTGSDLTGAITYTGSTSGDEYTPQFILQDHVATDNFQKSAFATVNKSASGQVEVVTFGNESFLECNMKWITDKPMPCGGYIRNNSSGVADLRAFMEFSITKAPVEYMADENDPLTYETLILDSTPEDQNGIGFKLKEQYARGLPGFFETGILRFRTKL